MITAKTKKKKPVAPVIARKIQYLENDPVFAKKKSYNPFLITKIQPQGNMNFTDDKFTKIGSYYVACLHVIEMPSEPGDFWLQGLMNLEDAMTIVDIGNNDMEIIKDKLDRSISELETRKVRSNEQQLDNQNKYNLLVNMQNDIIANHETVKETAVRLYIYGHTVEEVENKIERVKNEIKSYDFQAEVMLNEQEYEMKSIMQPISHQAKNANHRSGIAVPSYALGLSWPFNNEDLLDSHGNYIGDTGTYGKVILDIFQKTGLRKSYDGVLVGMKGSGKSTLLKLLMKNYAVRGNYIRVLDCTGEFTNLAKLLGGTVVSMDSRTGQLNCMEIFPGAENAGNASTFAQHLSKLNTLYRFVSPDSDDYDRNEFEEYARQLYSGMGIYDADKTDSSSRITGLPPEKYPTLSNLLSLIQKDLYLDADHKKVNPDISETRRARLERIELTVRNLVRSYPSLFDSRTTLPNLTNQKVVVYNVQNIATMKGEIFQALLFNVLNLMLADMTRIGGESKRLYEEEHIPTYKVPKLFLLVDEAHRFINTKNPLVLDYMTKIVREGRKYFTSLFFASQSIRDFAPEANNTEGIDRLKVLFELVQYKFIMQQDSNSTGLLRRVFGDTITDSQLSMIPQFKTGETILLTGEQNLHMMVNATQRDIARFQGGA